MADTDFQIQRQFIKDMSYESFLGVELFTTNWQPKIEVDVATRESKVRDGRYLVELLVTVRVDLNDKPAFLIEVNQAGVFDLEGVSGEQLEQTLAVLCPTFLFPYAREAVDNVATKAGSMPIGLQPIDFESLYFSRAAANQQQAASA